MSTNGARKEKMTAMTPDVYEPYFSKVTDVCLKLFDIGETIDPFALLTRLMTLDGLPMHCPVHHFIMPATLLTTCLQRQGDGVATLRRNLEEAEKRARKVLPGFCGFYGACGAAVGVGIFFSVITDATPYSSDKSWSWANRATGQALMDIAALGGPRCCKRTCYRAFQSVLPQLNETLDIVIKPPTSIQCMQHQNNMECLRTACPYYPETEQATR